jgi:hypothetical protein
VHVLGWSLDVCKMLVQWFAWVFGRLLYTCLHPLSVANKVSGESWQLITTTHDELYYHYLWMSHVRLWPKSFLSC